MAALGMGALPTLLKGGALVLQERVEPGEVLAAIEQHRITSLSGVPTTFQLLAEHPDWTTTDLSSLRKLTCGGSSVPTRVADAYEERGLSFSSGYGMTETSPGATSLPYRKAREHAVSAGLPHFFTDVRIVGPDPADIGGIATGRRCSPHSLCSGFSHHQRPARTSSPGATARVHGAQPMLG